MYMPEYYAEKDKEKKMNVKNAIAFLQEAARYFKNRPTGGEDRAYWSNVYNAENCLKIAKLLEENSP